MTLATATANDQCYLGTFGSSALEYKRIEREFSESSSPLPPPLLCHPLWGFASQLFALLIFNICTLLLIIVIIFIIIEIPLIKIKIGEILTRIIDSSGYQP